MVIVDEVHERDMLTDFLLILLREAAGLALGLRESPSKTMKSCTEKPAGAELFYCSA